MCAEKEGKKFNPDECEISRIRERFPSALYVHFIKIWRREQLRVQIIMIIVSGWEYEWVIKDEDNFPLLLTARARVKRPELKIHLSSLEEFNYVRVSPFSRSQSEKSNCLAQHSNVHCLIPANPFKKWRQLKIQNSLTFGPLGKRVVVN